MSVRVGARRSGSLGRELERAATRGRPASSAPSHSEIHATARPVGRGGKLDRHALTDSPGARAGTCASSGSRSPARAARYGWSVASHPADQLARPRPGAGPGVRQAQVARGPSGTHRRPERRRRRRRPRSGGCPTGASARPMRPASSRSPKKRRKAVDQTRPQPPRWPSALTSRSCSARRVIEPTSVRTTGMRPPRVGCAHRVRALVRSARTAAAPPCRSCAP